MYRKLEYVLNTSLRWYGVTLRWSLQHRVPVMLFGVLILVGTAWEFWVIPSKGSCLRGFVADRGFDRSQSGHFF